MSSVFCIFASPWNSKKRTLDSSGTCGEMKLTLTLTAVNSGGLSPVTGAVGARVMCAHHHKHVLKV